MRYICIDKLKEVMGEEKFNTWNLKAETHLNNIRTLSKEERAEYFSKNNIWTELYPYLSKLSHHKCWYTESPENSSEWEIDHYRPKNQSKSFDGSIILEEGYWWLAYYWRNYRLCGSLVNRLRKDRFNSNDEVYGKGSFFPLELDGGYKAAPEDFICRCEYPYLLDPTEPDDILSLSFDEDGYAFPTYGEDVDPFNHKRATLSIKYYGLNQMPLIRSRKKVLEQCKFIISEYEKKINLPISNPINRCEKQTAMNSCCLQLMALLDCSKPFSMVARSFLMEKSEERNYQWLKNVIKVL